MNIKFKNLYCFLVFLKKKEKNILKYMLTSTIGYILDFDKVSNKYKLEYQELIVYVK